MPRTLPLLLLLAAAAAQPPTEPTTAASWIWYPERVSVEGAGQTRYFRLTVALTGQPAAARLWVMADDRVTMMVNGRPAPEPAASGRAWRRYDLGTLLRTGRNVLAFEVLNSGGPGGLLLGGTVALADGTALPLHSDPSVRTSREAPTGWQTPEFDDSGWLPARVVGSAFSAPWYGHEAFDLTPFIAPAEHEAHQRWREVLVALPPGLEAEPDSTASLGYHHGQVALLIDGQPRPALIYRGTVDPLSAHGRRQIGLFREAGVHVYCAYYPLAACWPAPGQTDFSALDDLVRGYLSADPQARVILILRLNAPEWWLAAHPEELVGYATGPIDSHDESGRVRRASFASQLWRREMGAVWEAAIAHLERQPWGKRVIGYHPGNGIYTEWHYFGSWREAMPDTGPAMTQHFRAWLRARYPNDQALQAAWGEAVTLATAAVPGVAARLAAAELGLRDPRRHRQAMDYYRCQQELTADCLVSFCADAKRLTANRAICGAFYGYFHDVPPQTQGGHLELPRALASPAVDYYAAPYDYSHRLPGSDGRLRALAEVFPLAGRVHMIEADTRTHLHPLDEYGRVPDLTASLAVIRREIATALTSPAALWWCDFGPELGGGWYDDPNLMAEVAALYRLAERRLTKPRTAVAEVAVLVDLPSLYAVADGEAMRAHFHLMDAVFTELHRTGTPFDTLLLSQLAQADLARYKALVVLNAFDLAPPDRARLQAAAAGRTVLWLGAPGWMDGERCGPAGVAALTGFEVAAAGGGRMVDEARASSADPLTARLPGRQVYELRAERRETVTAAADAAAWYNPRDAKTMAEQYRDYRWSVVDGTLRWQFAAQVGWTDLHLTAAVPQADGLALTVAAEGEAVGLSLRLVIKDAAAEFVAPRMALSATPQNLTIPLAAFVRAPWSRAEADHPRLPLTGFKLVVDGSFGGVRGTVLVSNLSAAFGPVSQAVVRGWRDPNGAHRCLDITDAEAQILAREAGDAVVMAARGVPGARQVLLTMPFVPREVLNALWDEAGVVRYVDSPEVIVRADSGLLALHTARAGRYELRLPRPVTLRDAVTGQVVGRGPRLPLDLPGPATTLLELE